jgi:hypothetical protein
MAKVIYLDVATDLTYDDEALEYISGDEVLNGINTAAEELKISAGAIAGALAEERMDYGFMQHRVDDYARYGAPLTAEQITTLSSNPEPEN